MQSTTRMHLGPPVICVVKTAENDVVSGNSGRKLHAMIIGIALTTTRRLAAAPKPTIATSTESSADM